MSSGHRRSFPPEAVQRYNFMGQWMARIAADPTTQEWWKRTDPCQEGLTTRKPGEWWAEMTEVFHCD